MPSAPTQSVSRYPQGYGLRTLARPCGAGTGARHVAAARFEVDHQPCPHPRGPERLAVGAARPAGARDTSLAIAALRVLGCSISRIRNGPGVSPPPDDSGSVAPLTVDVGNAGTVMRFLPAVAAVLSAAPVAFDGDPRAGNGRSARCSPRCARWACRSTTTAGARCRSPCTARVRVRGGPVTLDASGSSQLVSGLLLAAPRFDRGVEVRHEGPPVPSLPHIEMTLRMLRGAGAGVSATGRRGRSLWRVRAWAAAPRRLHRGA